MFLFCKHIKLLSLLIAFFQPFSSKFGLQNKVFKKAVYYRFINIKTYFDFRHGCRPIDFNLLFNYVVSPWRPLHWGLICLSCHKVAHPWYSDIQLWLCVKFLVTVAFMLVVISCKLYYGSLKRNDFHKSCLILLLFKMLIQNVLRGFNQNEAEF